MRFLRPGLLAVVAVAAMAFASGAWAVDLSDAEEEAKKTHITHDQFDPSTYEEGTEIDNRWFPLVPGTQYVLDGTADRGAGVVPHQVVFTVTGVTKVVNGVRTLAAWDRDFSDGQLIEEEIAFFAQDDFGTVWGFGEYPEEYEGDEFVGAPATWLAGVEGAEAGIHMRAKPRVGTPDFVQGFAPAIEFFNLVKVHATRQKTCIPLACYRNVVIQDESDPLEPAKGHVHKYYAPGVGIVRVEPVGNPEMETLALTEFRRLSSEERAEANARTLELDARAYEFAADVYGDTAPAELLDDDDEHDD
jgi:hypothetical protein